MFTLFSTPTWFNGYDLLFAAVNLVIALLIAGYSWKIFKINKENKFGYFSFAFILIALAHIFKLMTQGLLYYSPWRSVATQIVAPVVGMAQNGVHYSDIFFRTGFFLSMITMLGAWLLIYFVSQKKSGRLNSYYEISQIGLFVYLVGLISFVSNFKYSVFYLTSSVILGMIVLNYYKNYLNTNKNRNAVKVMSSFMLLLFGNISFIFVFINESLYVIGELFMLLGFLLLLYTHHKVTHK
ncbi:hypothetical protein COV12_00615 [Candidatus Woesearchaeota archaeon CG10_big_fil_rev_8_21_14_0_10_32_24]|nr:MAG: hypothetical protein COV12_00615 [Candidatus Woesearchaeota archaeon CG10_big_fil_rev_8_21_14_0_10_32_24]